MSNPDHIDFQQDYYALLGVLPTAEDVVIKGAYRALAQRYHPDRFEGSREEATLLMAAINDAYRVLSDPELRSQYDQNRGESGAPMSAGSNMGFEVEQYRPFAQRLHEWGYGEQEILGALLQRGVRPTAAEYLSAAVSGSRK